MYCIWNSLCGHFTYRSLISAVQKWSNTQIDTVKQNILHTHTSSMLHHFWPFQVLSQNCTSVLLRGGALHRVSFGNVAGSCSCGTWRRPPTPRAVNKRGDYRHTHSGSPDQERGQWDESSINLILDMPGLAMTDRILGFSQKRRDDKKYELKQCRWLKRTRVRSLILVKLLCWLFGSFSTWLVLHKQRFTASSKVKHVPGLVHQMC